MSKSAKRSYDASEYADDFFSLPALSLSAQPNLKALCDAVADPTQNVTFVIGAGVSYDAGLPDWVGLLENMADSITEERWRKAAKADRSDPLRKAEYIAQLACEGESHSADEVARNALYTGGQALAPGRLADAIARLAFVLDGRINIITTNFDELYEQALKEYGPSEPEFSRLTLADFSNDPVELDHGPLPLDGKATTVAHLHGLLVPKETPVGPIVLSESSFLKHGHRVRRIIKRLLRESCVVFVGVSLSDPNLVGPLWDLKDAEEAYTKPFLFMVASGGGEDEESAHNAKAFVIKRTLHLSHLLGVCPIFLKSYAQLQQAFYELTMVAQLPDRYRNIESADSIHYGDRLQKALTECYSLLGADGFETLVGQSARSLSESLLGELQKGAVGDVLNEARQKVARNKHPEINQIYRNSKADLDSEHFALFLWLRAPAPESEGAYEYQLRLMGTSAYVHNEAWSVRGLVEIRSDARHVAAKAAFSGQSPIEDLDGPHPRLWKTCLAVPFRRDRTSVNDALATGQTIDTLTVGVITLNSTNEAVGKNDWDPSPRSLLTLLSLNELETLKSALAAYAVKLVSKPTA